MISYIFLFAVVVNIVLSVIINVRTVKWHIFHITFLSVLFTTLILYWRLFIYYSNNYFIYGIYWSLLVALFIIIPLMIYYDKSIKEHFKAIVYGTFFSLIIVFFPINSAISVLKDYEFMSFKGLMIRVFINVFVYFLILGVVIYLGRYKKIVRVINVMGSVIFSILVTSLFAYDGSIDLDDISFDYQFEETAEIILLDQSIDLFSVNIYGFYEDKLYYYTEDNDSYVFGLYDIAKESNREVYHSSSCLNFYKDPMFYQGYTYFGCDGSLGVLHGDNYEVIVNEPDVYFGHAYSIVQDEQLYIYVSERRYTITEVNVLNAEDYSLDYEFTAPYSFISSINNKLFMYSIDQVYYDGYTYDIEFGRYNVVYKDGYIYIPGQEILKEGLVDSFPTGTGSLVTIDDKLYAIGSRLVNFDTSESYLLYDRYWVFNSIEGMDSILVFDLLLNESHFATIDITKAVVFEEEYSSLYNAISIIQFYSLVGLSIGVLEIKELLKRI